MARPLRLLIIEDSEDDARLIARSLARAGYELHYEQVHSAEAVRSALDRETWDIIVSDFSMPHFGGGDALKLLRERDRNTPFIFVSGTIGEDVAVEAMRSGAQDYVIKNNLTRLVPAIERELRNAAVRREAEEARRARERHQAALAKLSERAIETADLASLFEAAVTLVSETLGVPYCAVLELAPDGNSLLLRAGVGWREGCVGHATVGTGVASQAGYTLQQGEPIIVEHLRIETRFRGAPLLHDHGIVSGVTVQIPSRHRPFGVLGAHTDRLRTFTQDDVHSLQAVAHVLGTTVGRDHAEAMSRQSQRLESVGRLAGGVAHDFNNLLTVITSYSELLLIDLESTDPRRADLEEIGKAASSAAGLTRQLLAFSRQQVLEPRVLDLNTIVSGAEKMLQRLIGEDVGLATVLAPNLGAVRADPGQLEQVIMNLAVNARDAMPDGGKITVETRNVELDATYTAEHTPVSPGAYVLLSVSDTGVGMDEQTKRRIFEPFFTTKEKGKGTGLGLSTVYGIVKQSGGFIWVYSEPSHGTSFKIYIPRVDEEAETEQRGPATPQVVQGTETILLVEDAGPLRAAVRQILKRNGYTVLEAADGKSALDEAAAHDGRIHLLITDVIMLEMSGRQLAERLKERQPEIRVLFVSGDVDDAIMRHGMLERGIAFLQKPFSPESLARKVREVLDTQT